MTVEPDLDRLRHTIADVLIALATISGDGRFKTASGMLTGRTPGRRSVDDTVSLRLVRALLTTGMARSRNEACQLVAELRAPTHQVETMQRRLMRKLRAELNVFHDDLQDHPAS